MVQMKDRKNIYCNKWQKQKTASGTRGFLLNSKIIGKSLNSTKQIIRQPERKLNFFLGKGVKIYELK